MAHAPDPEYWHGIILHSPGMAYWHGLVPYPYAYRWIGHGQRAATQQRYGFGAAAPETIALNAGAAGPSQKWSIS